jgi:hypothetical protein
MNINDKAIVVILSNTVYWDGTYILNKVCDWQYECEFCFSIKAYLSNPTLIELNNCSGTVARFYFSNLDEVSSASDIHVDYICEMDKATAKIEFINDGQNN